MAGFGAELDEVSLTPCLARDATRVMATLGLVKFVRVKKILKPVSHVLSCFEISLLNQECY